MMMKKELFKGLNEEQIAKAKACKSQDELLSLAKEEGFELTEEQLNAVSGGGCFSTNIPDCSKKCPNCGTKVDGKYLYRKSYEGIVYEFTCPNCGHKWKASFHD